MPSITYLPQRGEKRQTFSEKLSGMESAVVLRASFIVSISLSAPSSNEARHLGAEKKRASIRVPLGGRTRIEVRKKESLSSYPCRGPEICPE